MKFQSHYNKYFLGTDSPFRETSNIYDGSDVTADMAVQNCIGGAARGATWVALHNGGGVGWGEGSLKISKVQRNFKFP